jgi:Flp pilus assembly protein TadG
MLKSKRPGQAMVEFALCAPLLLMLLTGIIDTAWLYNHQLMLINASREGARLGALGKSASDIRDAVRTDLTDSGFTPVPTDGQIAVDLSNGTAKVTLTVSVPWLFAISGPALDLKATAQMRLE